MGCGTLFVNVNEDNNGLCEVFANLGKAGGCPAQSEATCRVVSAALRSGVGAKVLIEQLKGIRCLSTITRRKDNKDINVLFHVRMLLPGLLRKFWDRIVNLRESP